MIQAQCCQSLTCLFVVCMLIADARPEFKTVTSQNKVSSVMGRDDSWPSTVPSVVVFFSFRSCAYDDAHDVHGETGSASRVSRLVTVHTNPFTRPTVPFLSACAKCQPGNTQNGRTVGLLPIANLMADSELGSRDSYSSFLVTIGLRLSRLVSEIFACDRQTDGQTDNADHNYSWPHIAAGKLTRVGRRAVKS